MRYRKSKVEALDLPGMAIENDSISNLLQRLILTILDLDLRDMISHGRIPFDWAEEGAINTDDARLSLACL